MSNNFDWNSEDVIVKPVDAIAVYTNTNGDIVIRQQSPHNGEDQIVVVPVSHVQSVVNALMAEAEQPAEKD